MGSIKERPDAWLDVIDFLQTLLEQTAERIIREAQRRGVNLVQAVALLACERAAQLNRAGRRKAASANVN